MSDLVQVLLMLAIPASVLLWCRILNRRDDRRAGTLAGSSGESQAQTMCLDAPTAPS